jgi:hypothetical protein
MLCMIGIGIGHGSHLASGDERLEVRLSYPYAPSAYPDRRQLATVEPVTHGLLIDP